ncbi:hypothetical protein ACREYJ_17325 [Pseudomonas kribbensis]|uniref:hypothetical protein n=1 Tax=Pseudomonas kribbensis TaxID=1628086 RepID=UPI003D77D624
MWQYDWPAWDNRIKSFTGKWALERWFLMYLHEQSNIDALALEIKTRLAAEGRAAQVRVQSIWVDGTPQAEFSPKGHSPRNKQPQCELADLLLCVRWESPNGGLQREQAMLIQAKVANKYNKLPGGKSTQKERLLFEDCNRHKAITLYPGVNRENPIGSYQLGSSAASKDYGLHDCASFLLMAKAPWPVSATSIGPLQVGWPLDKKKTEIKPPDSFLEAVISMVCGPAPELGREVKTGASAKSCVWTKMVNDLRGKYETVRMSGYNGQARVTTSAGVVSAAHFVHSLFYQSQNYRDFALGMQNHSSISPFFLHWFNETRWELLKQKYTSSSSKYPIAFIDLYFFLEDYWYFSLWRDEPTDPPPLDSDFDFDKGPHIPTLIITMRNDEQYEHPYE